MQDIIFFNNKKHVLFFNNKKHRVLESCMSVNSHGYLSQFTHDDLNQYTHDQIYNDIKINKKG